MGSQEYVSCSTYIHEARKSASCFFLTGVVNSVKSVCVARFLEPLLFSGSGAERHHCCFSYCLQIVWVGTSRASFELTDAEQTQQGCINCLVAFFSKPRDCRARSLSPPPKAGPGSYVDASDGRIHMETSRFGTYFFLVPFIYFGAETKCFILAKQSFIFCLR